MKKFRFSLQSVLDVKRQIEEQRQRELAEAQARRDRSLLQLGAFENELRQTLQAHSGQRLGRIDLNLEAWHLARHKGLNQSIALQTALLDLQTQQLDAARESAVQAARDRRVLEKLEETQRAEWQLKLNLEEQGFMDEMAQRARQSFTLPTISADPA